eukprot:TRINITY_DN3703_c0_g5_i1.p3 TRINITY_DN3703_c0_g5~~TRINITY_DN3703_c0_g5_i1.p3  ORF type:complete len:112 (-),score=12.53 TRINITY_DN3703_c0_g5_i1:28-363(-)
MKELSPYNSFNRQMQFDNYSHRFFPDSPQNKTSILNNSGSLMDVYNQISNFADTPRYQYISTPRPANSASSPENRRQLLFTNFSHAVQNNEEFFIYKDNSCLLYTSDAADE